MVLALRLRATGSILMNTAELFKTTLIDPTDQKLSEPFL
ncbi:hypothetical protein BH24ACT19_BH24ACT19_21670 [soil metagenome]|jgi:hypothetical protein